VCFVFVSSVVFLSSVIRRSAGYTSTRKRICRLRAYCCSRRHCRGGLNLEMIRYGEPIYTPSRAR
jgi:hypothetical protein